LPRPEPAQAEGNHVRRRSGGESRVPAARPGRTHHTHISFPPTIHPLACVRPGYWSLPVKAAAADLVRPGGSSGANRAELNLPAEPEGSWAVGAVAIRSPAPTGDRGQKAMPSHAPPHPAPISAIPRRARGRPRLFVPQSAPHHQSTTHRCAALACPACLRVPPSCHRIPRERGGVPA